MDSLPEHVDAGAPRTTARLLSRAKLCSVIIAVGSMSGVMGALFGLLAGLMYDVATSGSWAGPGEGLGEVGCIVGGLGGLAAAIGWLRYMSRLGKTSGCHGMIGGGGRRGIREGLLVTLVLHAGLVVAAMLGTEPKPHAGVVLSLLGVGLPCGMIAGVLVGRIGGALMGQLIREAGGAAVKGAEL